MLLQSPEELRGVGEKINRGAVFVYPTETIYGIGGRGDLLIVKERVLGCKKRPPENPMILIAADRALFDTLDITFPETAEILARTFWPGLLTLVVPSRTDPGGVAIRVSSHPFIAAISQYCRLPLISTSANISGQPYIPEPDRIFEQFQGKIDFMIDAGVLPNSEPSSVVKVSADNAVTVIRDGAVSQKAIFKALRFNS